MHALDVLYLLALAMHAGRVKSDCESICDLQTISCSRAQVPGLNWHLVVIPYFLLCREFVVSIMSEWFIEAANHCCGNFDYGENEMQISGLTPMPSVKV